MNKKTELRTFIYSKKSKRYIFKKSLALPTYLSDIDSFPAYLYKHCGDHLFHIEFRSSYDKWLKLCDIRIQRHKKTGIEYYIPQADDAKRLKLLLKKNRKTHDALKIATRTSKNTAAPKKDDKDKEEIIYD
ncbi:MAG: hypothetical protein U9P44_03115 [archaeon]|nr:hypothetical protein [archaeon]